MNVNLRNVSLSFFIATLLFVTSVVTIGAVVFSYENKQFRSYVEGLSKVKQQVILLGLLTESQLDQHQNSSAESIESQTSLSFRDAIYSLDSSKSSITLKQSHVKFSMRRNSIYRMFIKTLHRYCTFVLTPEIN